VLGSGLVLCLQLNKLEKLPELYRRSGTKQFGVTAAGFVVLYMFLCTALS